MTQRELAKRAGVPQSTIARIESAAIDPRVETIEKLLGECGYTFELEPRYGIGIDRTIIADHLKRSVRDRITYTAHAAKAVADFVARARRPR